MRGARFASNEHWFILRIIPAYAGSTDTSVSPCLVPEDHPRVCGEHYRNPDDIGTLDGSSPRMRGAPINIH